MAWRKNDPNLTNDPAYLEPKITKLTEDLAENTQKLSDVIHLKYLQSINKGMQDSTISLINSKNISDNTAGTIFLEDWTDLTDWTFTSPNLQVSGGNLYSGGAGGGNSGAVHSYALSAIENLRAVFSVTLPSIGSSGGVILGVSSDAAGAVPAAGGAKAFGIYIPVTGNVKQLNMGTFADLDNGATPVQAGTYQVTVTVDSTYISVVATKTDGSLEVGCRRLRSGFAVNNLYLFNSDTRALTGAYVGKGSARKGLPTINPRTYGEGVYKTVQWTGDGTQSFKIYLPKNYDSLTPAPLAVMWHGNGSDETQWSFNYNMSLMQKALVDAGYIVLGCSLNASKTTWGNAASTNAYYEAYNYVKNNYAISSVVFYANSMGGIESLNALSENKIPCVAWAGTVPTYDLKNNYDNSAFTSIIKTAYGIASDGSDYATKTAGRNPALMPASTFKGIPMWMAAPPDDTTVLKSTNMDKLADSVRGVAMELITVDIPSGGHSVSIAPYTSQIVSFFNKYAL